VLVCALVAAVAVAWPPRGGYAYKAGQRSVYDWSTWMQVALLTAAGLALPIGHGIRVVRRAACMVAVASGAQLAGAGVVAFRRWITSGGFGTRATNPTQLRAACVVLVLAGLVAGAVGFTTMWHDRTIKRRPHRVAPVATFFVGCILAVWLPFAIGYEPANRTTQVGAHALMYSLPWAAVLVLSGWVDRITAYIGAAVVVLSAVPLRTDAVMIPAPDARRGFVLALFAALAAVVGVGPPRPPVTVPGTAPDDVVGGRTG
jgi:hypothetical protein